jgi:hypothetical protein
VDCAADYSCNTVTQKCLKDDGQGCSADAECYHGFCTDGYCCNARCNGACESCRLTGKHGYCDPVAAGGDPDNECELQDPSTCGRTGYCSGNRSCQLYQDGTVCEAATCSGNISNLPHKCNGLGNCAEGGTQACLPYVCNGATGLCKTSCTLSTDCQTNYTCDTASLTCKKNDGQSCGTDAECYHGFCTDSVCCASRCNGTCESCNQAGRAGYCDPVPANTDPQGECDWSNPATCGLDGFCSGSRSCRLWGTDTVCDTASCNGSMVVREKKCDGAEHCATQTPATLDCGAYLCNPITRGCYTDCSGGFECAPGSACAADKTCRKQAGAACQSDAECASGFCTDNTCCADRCHGKCEKCNMQGRAGFCDPVASELDPDSECEDQGAASCGTIGYCSGQRSCALYPAGTVCSQSYCSGNTLYRNDACNGNGFCTDGGEQNCIPYACDTATKTCKNCVGCLQGNSDCNEACRRSGKPGGYCIDSESTDPSRCCICYPDTGCENCLPPGQPSCWAACRAMGAQAGWCGNPGSVDPTNCCACLW